MTSKQCIYTHPYGCSSEVAKICIHSFCASHGEQHSSERDPAVLAGALEEPDNVVGRQRAQDPRVPHGDVVDAERREQEQPEDDDGREQEGHAARPPVLQGEEAHQHDARQQHHLTCRCCFKSAC